LLDFTVPDGFRCPVSQELIEDAVTTSDGFSYERSSIRRWFDLKRTSPMTGLELPDTTLRNNRELFARINKWVAGDGIQPRYSRQFRRKVHITFECVSESFRREIYPSTSCRQLYEIAYRALKGRHQRFQLVLNNRTPIPVGEATISSQGIHAAQGNVHITVAVPRGSTAPSGIHSPGETPSSEEKCLIKVYTSSRGDMLFGFWVDRLKTKYAIQSIAFKLWRYQAKMHRLRPENISHMAFWRSLRNTGDHRYTGFTTEPWEQLCEYLNSRYCIGHLGKELAWQDPDENNRAEPSEHPFVLKVLVMPGNAPLAPEPSPVQITSRMDVLKAMFDQFTNKLMAYGYRTHIGLVTFSKTARVARPLTDVMENFRDKVNGLSPQDDTALWDALALAADQLTEYGAKYPKSKQRILCISDGVDTGSERKAIDLCGLIARQGIVVDSFCLGNSDDQALRRISKITGGYKFWPRSLDEAMAICEMEPVLNQLERPLLNTLPFTVARWRSTGLVLKDKVTRDEFPKRCRHPNLDDDFIEIVSAHDRRTNRHGRSGLAPPSLREARLLAELRNMSANPHPHYDVYVSESNISFWKIVMQGPPGSPYATGTFVLYMDMEANYPSFAPKARFVTLIHHPNVNLHGRICHSIFDRNWTTDTTNTLILNTVYGLLLVPDYSDPV
jgi:ubiquitin-protein ligase